MGTILILENRAAIFKFFKNFKISKFLRP